MRDWWTVAQTKPGRELYAAENIVRQGHECYLPKIEQQRTVRRRHVKKIVPLFPNYIFVLIEQGQWHFLKGTFGISHVLAGTQGIAEISEKFIAELRAMEEGGIVKLPEKHSGLVYGQRVRVTDESPFHGELGIYQDMGDKDRVNVLLNVMGRPTRVIIRRDQIEAA